MIVRSLLIAAGVAAFSQASAAQTTMPIHFVGDWCFESEDGAKTTYALPSWTEGGVCTKILSVTVYGFHGQGNNCDPLKISLKKDSAPSGTSYTAQIRARCQPDGPVTDGKRELFEFYRYKGHLEVVKK
jgi:hypothetical protein